MIKKPAPLSRRFAALGLDYLIIIAYGIFLLGVTLLSYSLVFGGVPDLINIIGPFGTQLIGLASLTLPVLLYFYFTEAGKHHASIGKRIVKIAVTNRNGGVTSRKQIAIRTLVKFLPWEIAHTFVHQVVYYSQNNGTPPAWVMIGLSIANILPLLYIGLIVLRKDHRGPHDLAAKTIVISTK